MRSSVLALLLLGFLVALTAGSAEAGKRVDWSAYLESPSERAASVARTTPAASPPKAAATRVEAKRAAKAKRVAKAKARTKAKRVRRK